MHDLVPLIGGVTFFYLCVILPVALALGAFFQERTLKFIGARFMGFEVRGQIFWSCVLGLVFGRIVSSILDDFGGQLLSFGVLLLATWPFLFLWVTKDTPAFVSLSHREAAILSASSSLATLVLMCVVSRIISFLIGLGVLAFLATGS